MRWFARSLVLAALLAAVAVPASAHADAAWTCSASAGWLSGGGQRVDAPRISAAPCATAGSGALSAAGAPGSMSGGGTLALDGGSSAQTIDARQPRASVSAGSLVIRSADGKLTLTASRLTSVASASCDANHHPAFTSSGSPGTVTLNGSSVDTSKTYTAPGLGVNGAPLLGKITIRFNEVTTDGTGTTRRAIDLIVTDSSGVVVFEAGAGEASVGAAGDVCAPPPVCPPGQQPQSGRCVSVSVTPLPAPPGPAPTLPPPLGGGGGGKPPAGAPGPNTTAGCPYADAPAGRTSSRRLARATLCLLNVIRKSDHLRRLRLSTDLSRAARRHARSMVQRHYFAHTEPDGAGVLDRVLQSGYLSRYGRWQIGENLGWGWGGGATPRSIVAAWMRSAPHRHNILDRNFHDVGVAVVLGSPRHSRRSGSVTYVLDFGGYRVATRAR